MHYLSRGLLFRIALRSIWFFASPPVQPSSIYPPSVLSLCPSFVLAIYPPWAGFSKGNGHILFFFCSRLPIGITSSPSTFVRICNMRVAHAALTYMIMFLRWLSAIVDPPHFCLVLRSHAFPFGFPVLVPAPCCCWYFVWAAGIFY